jgi:hypothetical protein
LHRYTAFGLGIRSDLQLSELTQDLATANLTGGVVPEITIDEGSHHDWPAIEPSPHSTPTLSMLPGDWRLKLEGVGWFRAWNGNRLSWERWDDSVSVDLSEETFTMNCEDYDMPLQNGQKYKMIHNSSEYDIIVLQILQLDTENNLFSIYFQSH